MSIKIFEFLINNWNRSDQERFQRPKEEKNVYMNHNPVQGLKTRPIREF
jgi:hypothetical protein